MDFVIDSVGDHASTSDNTDNSLIKTLLRELNDSEDATAAPETQIATVPSLSLPTETSKTTRTSKFNLDEILKKSVLTPDFEKLHSVPQMHVSDKKLRLQRQREREKTKGSKWYGLPATEMTEEIKNDLQVLQMRSVLDPKHFYKKNDLKVLPKYFQVGKVLDAPLDYYNNRLSKKEKKRTLVDELLADAEFNKYNKRKYKEIIEERQKTHYKAYKQAKKLKRKHKK